MQTRPSSRPLWTGTCPMGRHPHGQKPPLCSACWDTVNKRAVLILLECIPVWLMFLLINFSFRKHFVQTIQIHGPEEDIHLNNVFVSIVLIDRSVFKVTDFSFPFSILHQLHFFKNNSLDVYRSSLAEKCIKTRYNSLVKDVWIEESKINTETTKIW